MASVPTIDIFEDPAAPEGGQAIVQVRGLSGDPGNAEFILRRFGYQKGVLGPDGWQGPEVRLEPISAGYADGILQLTVGPSVVDAIDVGTPVEIELPAVGIRHTLNWPSIAPSVYTGNDIGRSRFAFARRKATAPHDPGGLDEPTVVALRPAYRDESRRTAQTGQGLDAAGPIHREDNWHGSSADNGFEHPRRHDGDRDAEDGLYPSGDRDFFAGDTVYPDHRSTASSADPERDRPLSRQERRSSGRGPWLLVILLAFLLPVGAGAYYLMHEHFGLPWPFKVTDLDPDSGASPAPEPPIAAPSPSVSAPEPPAQVVPIPPAASTADDGAAPARDPMTAPAAFARMLLEQNRSPEETYALALIYLQRGEADVALLLLEDAQARDYPPAIATIGRLYDPVHFDPRESPFSRANPLRAAEYYRRAAAAGDLDAAAALAALEVWLRAAAAEGDPVAQDVLDRW